MALGFSMDFRKVQVCLVTTPAWLRWRVLPEKQQRPTAAGSPRPGLGQSSDIRGRGLCVAGPVPPSDVGRLPGYWGLNYVPPKFHPLLNPRTCEGDLIWK